MKVVMLIQETPEDFADRGGPAAEAYWGKWMAYSAALGDKVVCFNPLRRRRSAFHRVKRKRCPTIHGSRKKMFP